jgi:hypothetical protein
VQPIFSGTILHYQWEAFHATSCCVFAVSAMAQYGTAPTGYYPDKYTGSTFAGVVTDTRDDQLPLSNTKGNKNAIFAGKFETPCLVPSVDKNSHGMFVSDIPLGTVMTVYFMTNTKKVEDQKIKENLILAIRFDIWKGQRVAEDKKKIYLCTQATRSQYLTWGSQSDR